MSEPATPEREPPVSRTPRNLGVRVGILLGFTIIVALGFLGYVLHARGVFEAERRVFLVTDNAEGVRVGMDLTFAGFPIGYVRRIRLRPDGKVRINVRIPESEAHWLRTSSVFTLELPLIGEARLRAYSHNLQDPPLENRAERPVLRGDTNAEIPRMVASLRQVLENLDAATGPGSHLAESLRHARTVTERMAGKQGVLGALMGSEENAARVLGTIDRTNRLLDDLSRVTRRLDGTLAKTDGVIDDTRKAAQAASALLGDVRARLKEVDRILADAQAAAANAKSASASVASATTDLAALRAEVEASLRKVASLIEEINRKWPFERQGEIRLP